MQKSLLWALHALVVVVITGLSGVFHDARAHHPRPTGLDASMAEVQTTISLTEYEFETQKGHYWRAIVEGVYRPWPWLQLEAHVPLVRLEEDDEESVGGVGDIEVGIGSRFYTSPEGAFSCQLVLTAELPTGSRAARLGGGHVALIPALTLTGRVKEHWQLFGLFAYSGTVSESGATHVHGDGVVHVHDGQESSPLAIHSEHELMGRGGFRYDQDFGYLGGYLQAHYGVVGPTELGPVSLGLLAGFKLDDHFMVVGDVDIPFAGKLRHTWQIGVGISWTLPTDAEAASDCGCGDESSGSAKEEGAHCGCESKGPKGDCGCEKKPEHTH